MYHRELYISRRLKFIVDGGGNVIYNHCYRRLTMPRIYHLLRSSFMADSGIFYTWIMAASRLRPLANFYKITVIFNI